MLSKEMHQHLPHQMKLLSIYIRAGSIPVLPRLAGLWRDGSWDESTCSYRAARAGSRVLVRSSLRERYFTTTSFLYTSKYLCIQDKKPKGTGEVYFQLHGVWSRDDRVTSSGKAAWVFCLSGKCLRAKGSQQISRTSLSIRRFLVNQFLMRNC